MKKPKSRLGINLTLSVLTSVFWPNYKTSDLVLPREMAKCFEEFKRFYETKTKHQKLTWIYHGFIWVIIVVGEIFKVVFGCYANHLGSL